LASAPPVGADIERTVSCLGPSTAILNAAAPGDAWADFHAQYLDAHAGS
jgi:hypothetical protein